MLRTTCGWLVSPALLYAAASDTGGGEEFDHLSSTGPESWLSMSSGADVVHVPRLMESEDMTVFAWVRLPIGSKDIQTVVSNRQTGCSQPKATRYGFALYINSWQSSDKKVKVGHGLLTLLARHGT